MSDEWRRMHGPSDNAPAVTCLVARCKVCGTQWQVHGDPPANANGCSFCDAGEEAISIHDETPGYGSLEQRR